MILEMDGVFFYFSPTFYWNLVSIGLKTKWLIALGLVQYLLCAQFTCIKILKQVSITFDFIPLDLITWVTSWWHHSCWGHKQGLIIKDLFLLLVSYELSYWFQFCSWGGGKKQKDSQLRVAVLESYYYLLDESLSDNFHIVHSLFMWYLGRGRILCPAEWWWGRISNQGVKLDLVRTNTDVFTPCALNPCPSLTSLPPAGPTPIPHMLSSAWDS